MKMQKLFLFYIFFLLLLGTACQDSRKKISDMVQEWEEREVHFPDHPVFTVQGRDTVDFSFVGSDYKIVSYVDSMGCVSCKLRLPDWKVFIAEVDSLTGGQVPFIFFFHPKKISEMHYLMRRDEFTYPACLDTRDELNRLNNFPEDIAFQTFLLDKQNRVKVLGNPVLNPRVKELYLRVLTGRNISSRSHIETTASVDRQEWDFGSFPRTQVQQCVFCVTNTGKLPLSIQNVITSCGCTSVEYDKEPVRPGNTLRLTVNYTAERRGRFHKTVTIYSNAGTLRLSVMGEAL